MLDHVEQQDIVVGGEVHRGRPLVQIVEEEGVDLHARGRRSVVDGRHVATVPSVEQVGHIAPGAAQVRTRAPGAHPRQRQRVWTRVSELEPVVSVAARRGLAVEAAVVEEPQPLGAGNEHRLRDIPGVLQAVHAADLVPVVGGDRQLLQPEPGEEELDDDLGVEVEVVRVQRERDLAQRPVEYTR